MVRYEWVSLTHAPSRLHAGQLGALRVVIQGLLLGCLLLALGLLLLLLRSRRTLRDHLFVLQTTVAAVHGCTVCTIGEATCVSSREQ
jgi:hypothetical protein